MGINIYVCIYIKHIYAPSRLVHIKQTTLIHSQRKVNFSPPSLCLHIKQTHRNSHSLHGLKIKKLNLCFRIEKLFVSYLITEGGNLSQVSTVGMVIVLLHREKPSPIIIVYEYLLPDFVIYVLPQNLFLFSLA